MFRSFEVALMEEKRRKEPFYTSPNRKEGSAVHDEKSLHSRTMADFVMFINNMVVAGRLG